MCWLHENRSLVSPCSSAPDPSHEALASPLHIARLQRYSQKVNSEKEHYFKKQPLFRSIVSNSKKTLQRSLSSDQMLSRQNIYFFFNYRRKLPFQHMA